MEQSEPLAKRQKTDHEEQKIDVILIYQQIAKAEKFKYSISHTWNVASNDYKIMTREGFNSEKFIKETKELIYSFFEKRPPLLNKEGKNKEKYIQISQQNYINLLTNIKNKYLPVAQQKMNENDYKDAIRYFSILAILEQSPNMQLKNPFIIRDMAFCYYKVREFDKSIEYYQEAKKMVLAYDKTEESMRQLLEEISKEMEIVEKNQIEADQQWIEEELNLSNSKLSDL